MVDKTNGEYSCSRMDEPSTLKLDPSILTFEAPRVEEIARVIWQRQHDRLLPDSISYSAGWRDQSIPSKFWDEFLRDAHAVLLLLYEKHVEYQNRITASTDVPHVFDGAFPRK